MIWLIPLFAFAVGCSSTQVIDGHRFTTHEADERSNLPQHGFFEVDRNQDICGDEPKVKGGYFVIPRKPRSGETTSEYNNYLAAEKIRVRLCAKASLWCSSKMDLFCKANNKDCKEKNRTIERSTCRIKPNNYGAEISPILNNDISNRTIICGTAQDNHVSALAWTTATDKAFYRDRSKWNNFCAEYRSKAECAAILREHESSSYLIEPDASRWAVDILSQEKSEVKTDGDLIYSTIELDVNPACKMIEGRH